MGFPAVYSEDVMPKFLIQIVFLLGHIRKWITLIFDAVGLGDIIRDTSPLTVPSSSSTPSALVHSANTQRRHAQRWVNTAEKVKPLYATLVQDALPVIKYEDTKSDIESCAVCLHKFNTGEEVRQLKNCRHVFHKFCIDPWMELNQRTCPLCRSPLVPDEISSEIDQKLWGNVDEGDYSLSSLAGWNYYYDDDYSDEAFGFLLPSQTEHFTWASFPSTDIDDVASASFSSTDIDDVASAASPLLMSSSI